MKKLRTALLIAAGWYVASAVVGHEHPVKIMFNPETDGPLLAERNRPSFAASNVCMTSVPVGSSGVPVFTTCGAITSSTSNAFAITTTGAGGPSR